MKSNAFKILCISALVSTAAVTGCSAVNTSSTVEGTVVYGDVTAVEDGKITIAVEEEKPGSSVGDTSSDDSESTEQVTSVDATDLTPVNETVTVEVSDDTAILKQDNPASSDAGGAPGGGAGGQAPSGEGDGGTPPDSNGSGSGDGDSASGGGGTPPEKPSGDSDSSSNSDSGSSDASSGNSDGGTPPEKPSDDGDSNSNNDSASEDGEAPSGEAPGDGGSAEGGEAPGDSGDSSANDTDSSSEATEITLDDIQIGDDIAVQYDTAGNIVSITVIYSGTVSSGQTYTSVTEVTEDTTIDGETIESTGTDENAIHALNNSVLTLSNATITQKSSTSTGGDNSSFYGVGAAVLESEGSAYISNTSITTDAAGGAGVFAYGEGVAYVADTAITTTQDTSGGIHAAGGGTVYAWDLTVETSGESSAAIRSDRGSGTMIVDGGTYTTNGTGSPAIYSTANIAVSNATGTANSSEAVCIEGQNALRLYNCDLTGNMKDDERNDDTWNVILYQSMSGDSEEGTSLFTMDGGSLTAKNGGQFYTTNTSSTFVLHNVDITNSEDSEFFFKATGNNNQRGWGTEGSNGADTTFTAIEQEMEGDVIWDSVSQVDFYMTDGSTLAGAVVDDESHAGNGGDGYCSVYIDSSSTWTVTGDSTLTNLYCAGTIVDSDGKSVTVKSTSGEVLVEGDSEYTITVSSYSTDVDLSGAQSITSWDEFAIEKPEQLG